MKKTTIIMIATAISGLLLTLGVIAITASYGIRTDMSPIVISNESTESVAITMADNIEVTQPEDRYLGISLSAGIEIIVADTTGSPRVEYPSGLAPYITVSERNGKLNLLINRPDSSAGRGYYRHIECSHPIRIITPASPAKIRSTLSQVPVDLKDAVTDSIHMQIKGTTHFRNCRLGLVTVNPDDLGQYPDIEIHNTSISTIALGERILRLRIQADSLSTVEAIDWHSTLDADASCSLETGRLRIARISFSSVNNSTDFALHTSGTFTLNTISK
ncbi:hypothetical protein EEL50_06095 [Muribaculaceae bacterium Isolate-105 (HZI)]|uniref:hypothetical protein n=2 Tax=Paramuribaculum intestinale TaxID=2094151 RepID=UPI000F4A65CE|nr:hypothetical protein [Paramuribaculum intestinale]ROT15273.1 hypothetical protein EEL50_06095 [Muribaculaceae bacterium Isolate-105 (HZI)]